MIFCDLGLLSLIEHLPSLSVVFLHASFRLRTFANKFVNKVEAAGFTKTVMGRILDVLGLKVELISFD